jgi:hypothetical protein
LVKTATVRLSPLQSVEVGLKDGKVLRVAGKAAREAVNAIALAKNNPTYHSTIALPTRRGGVVVVAVDGKKLDATIKA